MTAIFQKAGMSCCRCAALTGYPFPPHSDLCALLCAIACGAALLLLRR